MKAVVLLCAMSFAAASLWTLAEFVAAPTSTAVADSALEDADHQFRILARRSDDGRLQFAVRAADGVGVWTEPVAPRANSFRPSLQRAGRWLNSSPLTLEVSNNAIRLMRSESFGSETTEAAGVGRVEIRVQAFLHQTDVSPDSGARVEFALQRREQSGHWDPRFLPRVRRMAAFGGATGWLSSTTVTLTGTLEAPDSGDQFHSCRRGGIVTDLASNSELVEDCEVLWRLHPMIGGSTRLNWNADTEITNWEGVTVGGLPVRVVGLELQKRHLDGELTGLIADLGGLQTLRLDGNSLAGRIPSKLVGLSHLTDLYLGDNSLEGCIPYGLARVANTDLASLRLRSCPQPTDVSYGAHTLGAGTYMYALEEGGPAVFWDVPFGLTLDIRGTVYSHSDTGGTTVGLILINASEQSWICIDLELAEECNRRIVTTDPEESAAFAALFDRLSDSIWLAQNHSNPH